MAATTKQNVAPIQAIQVCSIKRRIQLYEIEQTLYKNGFKDLPFFSYKCQNVYKILDKINSEIEEFEKELTNLQEQAELFEIQIPEFKLSKQLRKVVRQVKQIWDYVYIVRSCMSEWKKTPWKKIDVEAMEMECKYPVFRTVDYSFPLQKIFVKTITFYFIFLTIFQVKDLVKSSEVWTRNCEAGMFSFKQKLLSETFLLL